MSAPLSLLFHHLSYSRKSQPAVVSSHSTEERRKKQSKLSCQNGRPDPTVNRSNKTLVLVDIASFKTHN